MTKAKTGAKRAKRERPEADAQPTLLRSVAVDEDVRPARAQRRGDVTNRHDEGSGANETIDGLDEIQEAARQGAEDIPVSERDVEFEKLPVFDRGESEPKI